jgi:hypothetical protein
MQNAQKPVATPGITKSPKHARHRHGPKFEAVLKEKMSAPHQAATAVAEEADPASPMKAASIEKAKSAPQVVTVAKEEVPVAEPAAGPPAKAAPSPWTAQAGVFDNKAVSLKKIQDTEQKEALIVEKKEAQKALKRLMQEAHLIAQLNANAAIGPKGASAPGWTAPSPSPAVRTPSVQKMQQQLPARSIAVNAKKRNEGDAWSVVGDKSSRSKTSTPSAPTTTHSINPNGAHEALMNWCSKELRNVQREPTLSGTSF